MPSSPYTILTPSDIFRMVHLVRSSHQHINIGRSWRLFTHGWNAYVTFISIFFILIFIYSDYVSDVGDTLTVDTSQSPGTALVNRLMQFSRPKTHPIFSDTRLSDIETVIINTYEAMWLTGVKMMAYIGKVNYRSDFIIGTRGKG